MFAFPEMLVEPAKRAGMKVPENPNHFVDEEYPHFAVFCNIQLGSPVPYGQAIWDNAKVIAGVPDTDIKDVTREELVGRGLAIGYPIP